MAYIMLDVLAISTDCATGITGFNQRDSGRTDQVGRDRGVYCKAEWKQGGGRKLSGAQEILICGMVSRLS